MEEVIAQTALPAPLALQVHPVMVHQQHQLACLVLIKETLGKHLARLVEMTRAIL